GLSRYRSKTRASGENIINTLTSLIDQTNLINITAPGTYAERAQFYQPSLGSTFSVTFPLFNTFDYKDIQDNWELCYILTYQNLANRRTINLLDPPVLYEATIEGLRHSPVTYINNLSITNVGNIRMVDIGIGKKPIPEAYLVKITFQELLTPSRNIFQYAL